VCVCVCVCVWGDEHAGWDHALGRGPGWDLDPALHNEDA
jgi:hypothetical protein